MPPALTTIVTRCLRADPAERYPTARAVADALAAVARSLGVVPSAQGLADHLERILPPPARQADASTMTESVITCELSRLVALPKLPIRRRRAPLVAALAAVVLLAAAWALRPVAPPPPRPPVAITTPPRSLAVVEPLAVEKPIVDPPPPIVHRKKAPPRPHRDWDGDSMLPP